MRTGPAKHGCSRGSQQWRGNTTTRSFPAVRAQEVSLQCLCRRAAGHMFESMWHGSCARQQALRYSTIPKARRSGQWRKHLFRSLLLRATRDWLIPPTNTLSFLNFKLCHTLLTRSVRRRLVFPRLLPGYVMGWRP